MKFGIDYFRKSVEWIQISLKSDENNGCFVWIPLYMYDNISLNFSYNKKRFRQKLWGNQKACFMFNISFFFKSCLWWDNVQKYCTVAQATDNDIIWRMRLACWIIKTTNKHTEYVTLTAFPREKWLRGGASLLRLNACCLSFFSSFLIVARK